MTRIKVCGLTRLVDALACAEIGVDILGFNFYPKSPRYITPEAARGISGRLRQAMGDHCPLLVGVFVNESASVIRHVVEIAGLDGAQLSGNESGDVLAGLAGAGFKAIRPRSQAEALEQAALYLKGASQDGRMPSLLVDAYHKDLYGGTGEQASVDVALAVRELVSRMMLAGGLTPENAGDRVRAIRPWGIDVASGVEDRQPGIKDHGRVRALIMAVKKADTAL